MNEAVATQAESTVVRLDARGGGKPATHPERPSLADPLPADVFTGHAAFLSGYRGYPVFSAPWFWRRTAIFAPLAAAVGFAQWLLIGLAIRDPWLGLLTAAVVAAPLWIGMVTVGPGLATVARHRRFSKGTERAAVVIAIVAGVLINCAGQYAGGFFTRAMLTPKFLAYFGTNFGMLMRSPHPLIAPTVWTIQVVISLCLGGGLALLTFFREQRIWENAQHARELDALRRDKIEADLRLTVLQAQVEPHFLFNTLASIHSLIRKDPHRAEAALEALVDHLRATLPRFRADVGSTHSTLDQQIDICASYLALMQVRMGHRLRYSIDVPPSLRRHPFPPLVLISLTENAIKHGIEPSASAGSIVVSAEVETHIGGSRLAVSIVDDGVGLKPGVGGGTGLRNIRDQLEARFGPQGSVTIRGRPVGGVAATIRVPYVETDAGAGIGAQTGAHAQVDS